jgi:hypothetical protein
VRLAVLKSPTDPKRDLLKPAEEIMQTLEAFDLTGSLRAAGELAGCSNHTVAKAVAARDARQLPRWVRCGRS